MISFQVFVGGSWSNAVPLTLYNVTTPIRFLSSRTATVNASFIYNVWDSETAKNIATVRANFEFTEAPNEPPVISVNPSTPTTLTTAQGTTASFAVTVTDFLSTITFI